MPGAGHISRAQAHRERYIAKRQKRRQFRRDARAAGAARPWAANHPHPHPHHRPQQMLAQRPLPPAPRIRSNWEVYATDPKLLNFDKCDGKNKQALSKDKAVLTQVPKPRLEASDQKFGVPGDRDQRFTTLTHRAQQSIEAADPDQISLQDVLKKHPELKFPGIDEELFETLARHINKITLEVTLKWVRKWCPEMKLSNVSQYAPSSHAVPTEALDMRFTKRKLTEVFGDYREAWAAHGVKPDARDVASLAEASIILCSVLKDNKTADLMNKLKDVTLWLNTGLGCKLLELQREASERLDAGVAESVVVSLLSKSYDAHRQEFNVKLLKHDKELVEHYWGPSGEDDPNPVPYPGESDGEGGKIHSELKGHPDNDTELPPSDDAKKIERVSRKSKGSYRNRSEVGSTS
ncbi:hypothetical protein F5B19DRAFT_503160 [Rostrohypoxylon terebratum]|nr:hypothetical protein F5B19DRAFT_503160 [Rostrohypoxylon terebratum]